MNRGAMIFLAAGLTATAAMAADPVVSMYDGNVLCVRPGHLTDSLPRQLLSMPATNRVVGTILDLRFADGDAVAVDGAVKLFSSKKAPLVILENGQTRGGAAELVVRLRAAGDGIIIGSTNGPGKISPDITVTVSAADEKTFLVDPFKLMDTNAISMSETNDLTPFIDHTSEAELVRKRIKDGEEDDSTPTVRPEPAQPVIRDPALARAVDLIKALAIWQGKSGA